MNSLKLRNSLLFLALLLIFSRCGQLQEATPTPGTFTSVYSIIGSHNCVECHSTTSSASNGGLNFSSKSLAYTGLTTLYVTGSSVVTNCGTLKLVQASSPSTSYLAGILFSDYYKSSSFAGVSACSPAYNSHSTSLNLSSSDQSSIIQWIQNGAAND